MKRIEKVLISTLLIMVTCISVLSQPVSAKKSKDSILNLSKIENGVVSANYKGKKNIAILVKKDGNYEQYVLGKKNRKVAPLNLGNGIYTIYALEQVKDDNFKLLEMQEVNVKVKGKQKQFLQSIAIIDFDKKMDAIKKAKKLTKNAKTDAKKIKIIHNYVVKNVVYDNKKASNPPKYYIPRLSETFETNKGICYDYASLTAGMLRSLGIPTKLVKGYNIEIDEYHAWNEVLVDGKWKILDTTFDAANNETKNIYKKAKDYTTTKKY